MLKLFSPKGYTLPRLIYTIHNLSHQGLCTVQTLTRLGIRAKDYLHQDSLQDPNQLSSINLTKAALIYCDAITTVSREYAKEIQHYPNGSSLETFIQERKSKLFGITNGIDYTQYSPKNDAYLWQNFCPAKDTLEKIQNAKKANKQHLLQKIGLTPNHKKPLIVSITRIDQQKGLDFFKRMLEIAYNDKSLVFILLGETTTAQNNQMFKELKGKYRNSPNIHLHLAFNQSLAHLMYAAADFLLLPSLFEPCGLTQMIAMRYGTIPIAHATGGLKETITSDCGILYIKPTIKDFEKALALALDLYNKRPSEVKRLQKNGLQKDFSFTPVAEKYMQVYQPNNQVYLTEKIALW